MHPSTHTPLCPLSSPPTLSVASLPTTNNTPPSFSLPRHTQNHAHPCNCSLPPPAGVGPIMNLQSNDAAKLWQLPSYIHMIWNGPFQVGLWGFARGWVGGKAGRGQGQGAWAHCIAPTFPVPHPLLIPLTLCSRPPLPPKTPRHPALHRSLLSCVCWLSAHTNTLPPPPTHTNHTNQPTLQFCPSHSIVVPAGACAPTTAPPPPHISTPCAAPPHTFTTCAYPPPHTHRS